MDKKILLITMAMNTTVQENVKNSIIQQQKIEKNSKLTKQSNAITSNKTKNTLNLKENSNKTVLKQFSAESKSFYDKIRLALSDKIKMVDLDKKNFFLHLSKFLLGLATDNFSDIDYSLVSGILMDGYVSDAKPKYANLAISNFKKTKEQSDFIYKVRLFLLQNKELLITKNQESNLKTKKTLTLNDVRKSEGKESLEDTKNKKTKTIRKVIKFQPKISKNK